MLDEEQYLVIPQELPETSNFGKNDFPCTLGNQCVFLLVPTSMNSLTTECRTEKERHSVKGPGVRLI